MKINFSKENITMAISIFLVCIIFVSVLLIQVKTVSQVNETDIENLRTSELSEQLSTWKSKYEEVSEELKETNSKILDYTTKIEDNEEASELLEAELEKSRLILGKTDVVGDGVVITLSDGENKIEASDLIELVNDLWFAGAEAISINGVRIVNMTEFVDVAGYIIVKPRQRIVSPYVVKVIGDQTYLTSTLSLKNSGFIDIQNSNGKKVTMEQQRNIKISAYSDTLEPKYIKEVTEE